MDEFAEIFKAVKALNEVTDCEFSFFTSGDVNFTVKTQGYSHVVSFIGIHIWYGDYDARNYDEATDTFESYFDCFKRRALEVIDDLSRVRPFIDLA